MQTLITLTLASALLLSQAQGSTGDVVGRSLLASTPSYAPAPAPGPELAAGVAPGAAGGRRLQQTDGVDSSGATLSLPDKAPAPGPALAPAPAIAPDNGTASALLSSGTGPSGNKRKLMSPGAAGRRLHQTDGTDESGATLALPTKAPAPGPALAPAPAIAPDNGTATALISSGTGPSGNRRKLMSPKQADAMESGSI